MKASRFNTVVRDGDTVLHHNTLYNGLIAARPQDHATIMSMLRNPEQVSEHDCQAKPYLDLLRKNRFLIDDDVDELEICRKLFGRNVEQTDSVSVTLMLSYACNFSCAYCFQRLSREKQGDQFLSEEMLDRLCAFLRQRCEGVKRLRLVWMGGEPLLHTEALIRYAAKLRAALSDRPVEIVHLIITNGYLLDEATLDALRANLENVTFQITIDGPPVVHNTQRPHRDGTETFSTIVENVERCLESDVPVVIRVNVDERSATFLPELFAYFDRSIIARHKDVVHLARIDHSLTADDLVDPCEYKAFAAIEMGALLESAERPYVLRPRVQRVSGCPGLGEREYMVDGGGRIFKCPRYMDEAAYAVGSLETDALPSGPSAERWRTWTPLSQNRCRACALLPVCMGGCPFRSITGKGQNVCGQTPHLYKNRLILQHRSRAGGVT